MKASVAVEATDFIAGSEYFATAAGQTADYHTFKGPNGCIVYTDATNYFNKCFNDEIIVEHVNKIRKNHKEVDFE
jgi:hypothetical protein